MLRLSFINILIVDDDDVEALDLELVLMLSTFSLSCAIPLFNSIPLVKTGLPILPFVALGSATRTFGVIFDIVDCWFDHGVRSLLPNLWYHVLQQKLAHIFLRLKKSHC